MWNDPNQILFLALVPEERRELTLRIVAESSIPPDGFCICLDQWEDRSYPNGVWQMLGVCMNLERFGCEDVSPQHLLQLMRSYTHAHLVWISRRACLAPGMSFAWILAHELRHGWQDLRYPDLGEVTQFLCYSMRGIDIEEPKLTSTVPTEFDADLAARAVMDKVFGAAACDAYIAEECGGGMMQKPEVFQKIAEHPRGKAHDAATHTLAFLRKYKTAIQAFQAGLDESDEWKAFPIEQKVNELNARLSNSGEGLRKLP